MNHKYPSLVEQTKAPEIDSLLSRLLEVIIARYGHDLRAIMVIGSYAFGDHRSDSDLDICYLWKLDRYSDTLAKRAWLATRDLANESAVRIDPMWNHSEAPFYNADDMGDPDYFPCGPILRMSVKSGSLLIWGEDIRGRIVVGNQSDTMRDVLSAPFNFIKRVHIHPVDGRNALDCKIQYPLSVPSPQEPDLGFGDLHTVVGLAYHMARTLVYLKAGQFPWRKSLLSDAFERTVGEPWVWLMQDIHRISYGQLTDQERQSLYQRVCRHMTDFENYFLAVLSSSGIDVSDHVADR